MLIKPVDPVDIETPTGLMRTHLFQPADVRRYPAIILYSEIYQMTAPIARLAALIAGHGYVVAVPEVYHEYEAPGTILPYDAAGTARGNALKVTKPVPQYDSDLNALLNYLRTAPFCNGRFGTFGVCLGGHLAFRAAVNPEIEAAACFYATDLHGATLGPGPGDDTLKRAPEIMGDLMMVWGRQDPHIPHAGRKLIRDVLEETQASLRWHEVDGQHAFMRDEAPRFDAALFMQEMMLTFAFYQQKFCAERIAFDR